MVSKLNLNVKEAEKETCFRIRLQKELTAICKDPITADKPFGDFDLKEALNSDAIHQVNMGWDSMSGVAAMCDHLTKQDINAFKFQSRTVDAEGRTKIEKN